MKAIRVHEYGGPEVLKLEELPRPTPGAGQVLVKLHASGVNPVDTYLRSGVSPSKPPLPYTPGMDGAGVVEAAGSGVTQFHPGDRVYVGGSSTGTCAEFALSDVAEIHPLPKQISFSQGAAINIPYSTAYRALFQKTQAHPGETLLIHGATGGVGIAATQLARAAGLTVIGTGGTDAGRRLVADQGAHHVLDHRAPDYLKRLLNLTTGRGADVILEMLANVNLGRDLTVLAPHGRICIIGSRGPVEINPRDAMSRDAVIFGMMIFNATPPEVASIHRGLQARLENGTLRPVVGREFPLAEAAQAHQAVLEPGALGKIVITI